MLRKNYDVEQVIIIAVNYIEFIFINALIVKKKKFRKFFFNHSLLIPYNYLSINYL